MAELAWESVDALGVNDQRALLSGRFKTQRIKFDVETTEQSDTHAGAPPPSRSRLHSGGNPISNLKFQGWEASSLHTIRASWRRSDPPWAFEVAQKP